MGIHFYVCVGETSPSELQPERQEDGTVTGKDRWRQKLLSAMAAGMPVTPPLLCPSFLFLLFLFLFLFSSPSLLPHLPFLLLQATVHLLFSSCPILWLLQSQLYRYLFLHISVFYVNDIWRSSNKLCLHNPFKVLFGVKGSKDLFKGLLFSWWPKFLAELV